jgi:vacuolar-type H+-ATPase subunit C/Vma6
VFLSLSDTFAGIAALCTAEGLSTFERELTTRYLVAVVRNPLHSMHPLMKAYFVRIIDARNIIALVKFLRLSPKTAPAFVPCGSIREQEFAAIIKRKDQVDILRLAGIRDIGAGLMSVEPALYRAMTRFLRKADRDPLGIGPVLDYLWRCSIEVMNLSTLFHGRGMDRDVIDREMVH